MRYFYRTKGKRYEYNPPISYLYDGKLCTTSNAQNMHYRRSVMKYIGSTSIEINSQFDLIACLIIQRKKKK